MGAKRPKPKACKIQNVIKNLHPDAPSLGVQSLRNIIRFSEATPLLARLLVIGGIWELLCEKTYERLMKCRSERVRLLVFELCFLCLSVFVGYSIHNSCMLRPRKGHPLKIEAVLGLTMIYAPTPNR